MKRRGNSSGQNEPKKRLTKQEKLKENIPNFIKNQPWYYSTGTASSMKTKEGECDFEEGDFLSHQRSQAKDSVLDINNRKGYLNTGINDSFKKLNYNNSTLRSNGKLHVCKNCGMQGHEMKDCLEKRGKKNKNKTRMMSSLGQSTKNTDVYVRGGDGAESYDSKRDRWYGYTAGEEDSSSSSSSSSSATTVLESKVEEKENRISLEEEVELRILGLQPKDVPLYFNDRSSLQLSYGATTIRLREDKAVYLKDIKFDTDTVKLSDFQKEGTLCGNTEKAVDTEEQELRYDPKTRIYKDETEGFVNPNNKMFYRYKTGEGLEFETMQKKLKFLQRQDRQEDSTLKLVDEKISSKVMIANPTYYERLLKKKTAGESGPAKEGEEEEEEGEEETSKKRDLSQLEASKSKGTSMDVSKVLDLYK